MRLEIGWYTELVVINELAQLVGKLCVLECDVNRITRQKGWASMKTKLVRSGTTRMVAGGVRWIAPTWARSHLGAVFLCPDQPGQWRGPAACT